MVCSLQFLFHPDAPQPVARKLEKILIQNNYGSCSVSCSQIYFFPDLDPAVKTFVSNNFCDNHLQFSPVKQDLSGYRIHVRFKRGVTDNVGNTARQILLQAFPDCMPQHQTVVSALEFKVEGLNESELADFAENELYNPLIQDCFILQPGQAAPNPELNSAQPSMDNQVDTVALDLTETELVQLSDSMTLALDEREMLAIKLHYCNAEVRSYRSQRGLPEWPTDIELECLAQTWSEHCHHKIFNARIMYQDKEKEFEVDSLFKTYIKGLTEKLNKPYLISVFHDNAGVVRLHKSYDLVYKVETHNSPSALDPYGGAMTGIVGVDRDPMGTGLGAELLAHVKGFCLGHPDMFDVLPKGLLHPKKIRDGVHQGVIDGGNQSGIPLLRGWEVFDQAFAGKPLVFCGTLGRLPRKIGDRDATVKEIFNGDLIVMVGGRVGKDGIHGATFSSMELSDDSPVQAVQIGDPITQKRMSDLLKLARDQNLYRAITDNGAGGLSSSIGEMAQLSGGAKVYLDRVPLKYAGLKPWEVFLSEAQERMSLAVPPEKLDQFLKLCNHYAVEATHIGEFTNSGYLDLFVHEELKASLNMKFLHEGDPRYEIRAVYQAPEEKEHKLREEVDVEKVLLGLISSNNLCSRDEKLRQYDQEVKGLSVIKLLHGVDQNIVPDASVLALEQTGKELVALSESVQPFYGALDCYQMAMYVVEEATRRIVASGANPDLLAGVDNFCWPSVVRKGMPDIEHKAAQLVRANQGLYDACMAFSIPLISGKDSMANDCTKVSPPISILPTLLFSLIGPIEMCNITGLEPIKANDLIYILGNTEGQLACSQLNHYLHRQGICENIKSGKLPEVKLEESQRLIKCIKELNKSNLLNSCHAPGMGGLIFGLTRKMLASGFGMEIVLDKDLKLTDWQYLFCEDPGRVILSCSEESKSSLEALLKQNRVEFWQAGKTTNSKHLKIVGNQRTYHWDLDELKSHYSRQPGEAS